MSRFRTAAVALCAVAALSTAVYAAGLFSGFPVVGGQPYCTSVSGTGTGTGSSTFPAQPGPSFGQGSAGQGGQFGSVCNVTAPAGPAFTGEEMVPADTELPSGQQPQTVLIPNAVTGSINTKRNRIIGGDFGINLWQRGTTPVSAALPTSAVMSADRWYAYSASSQMTVIKETAAADTTANSTASMRVQRPSGQTGTGAICVGQVLDRTQAEDFLGQNAILSFSALAGANLSSVGGNLVATVAYYTAADSATPGTNTGTFATGLITGYTAAVAGVSNGTTGTVTSGAATVQATSAWTRFTVYAPIPAVNAAGTAIVGVGISICDTPVGTAGTNDWFEIANVSLNATPSTPTALLPNGVTSPIGFERRSAADELLLQQYYSYGLQEVTSLTYAVPVLCSATANALISIEFPTQMREVPTVAVTAGGFSIQTAVAKTAIGTTTLATGGAQHSTLTSAAACTSTLPYQLVGTNTTGLLMFSAEP